MLSLLFYPSVQLSLFTSKVPKPIVEGISTPSFDTFDGDENELYSENANMDITIKSATTGKLRPHVYYQSSLTVNGVNFIKNNAFGGGADSGYGGAMYLCWSMLSMAGSKSRSKFEANSAVLGGAICCLTSPIYITDYNFNANTAYKYGGAIYFQGSYLDSEKSKLSATHKILIKNSEMSNNKAYECGGAIATSDTEEIYIENGKLIDNRAFLNGGGLFAYNTNNMHLFDCYFIRNRFDSQFYRHFNGQPSKLKTVLSKDQYNPVSRVRGGGAIYFSSDNKFNVPANTGAASTDKRTLITNKCCFAANVASTISTSFGNGIGNALLFEGYCYWQSNEDSIKELTGAIDKDPSFKQFVAYNAKAYTDDPDKAFSYSIQSVNVTECWINTWVTYTDSPLTSESNPSFASPSNTGDDNVTAEVPSPSVYTYQATPISALPKATKDRKSITPARTWDYNEYPFLSVTTRSVIPTVPPTPTFQPTAIETPFETVHLTPFTTALETPFQTASETPLETAFETPNETPFTTAQETPLETPFDTPFNTALETPFETAVETPFTTAFETVVETPFTTAFETVVETPFTTAFDTAVETPFSTAHSTPHSTAFQTAEQTPDQSKFVTPFSTAHTTPYETPFSTAFQTAFETPFSTAFSTAYETPFSTAFETAFETPFVTAFETPFSTAFQTAFETAFETPFSTVFETAFETPFSTADSTAFETAFETPILTALETAVETPYTTPLLTPDETKQEASGIVVSSEDNGFQVDNPDNFKIIVENKWIIIVIVAVIVILLLIILLALIIWMILPHEENPSNSDSVELPEGEDWGSVDDSGETVDVSDVDIDNDGAIASGLFDKQIEDVSDSGETMDISDTDVDEAANIMISGMMEYGESID